MISLRVSDVEYEALKKQYRNYGARNVSDLARIAFQRIMSDSVGSTADVAAKLAEFDGRLHALEARVAAPVESRKATS